MIKTSDSKEITSIYTKDEKEIIEVRDSQNSIVYSAIKEISGVPPLQFVTSDLRLLDYRIYGNTVQDGTPAPENPAEVQGCGERTENLFDKSTAILGKTIDSVTGEIIDSTIGRFTSDYIKVNKNDTVVIVNGNDNDYFWLYDVDKKYTSIFNNGNRFTASKDGYIRISNNADINMAMVVKSPTRPDNYIPYGYKIPVTVSDGRNAVTTPVYIGSEPLHKIGDCADYIDYKSSVVVRGIKKLVLTGEEAVSQDSVTGTVHVQLTTTSATVQVVCTHFMSTPTIPRILVDRIGYAFIGLDLQRLYFGTRLSTDEFKTYLAAQYSAGTPVTVWYVLATPEEEPLENLLPIQTIKGSDILTVDTAIQPSNIWIKGKIEAIKEISGVPPLHFASRGEHLLDYRIYGNTVQNGTPAPENPAEVQGCGERTENLFDKDVAVVYNAYITRGGKWYYANDSRSVRIRVKPNTQYTLSTEGRYMIFRILEMQSDVVPTEQDGFPQMQSILIVYGENQSHYTFRTSENAKYIVFQSNLSVVNNWLNELMLVEGNSIRSDYIPYGYKIPVTVSDGSNAVTTPVYIGSEPLHKIDNYADYVDFERGVVVRNIKKLVLTEETNVTDGSGNAPYRINTKKLRTSKSYIYWCCSHYEGVASNDSWIKYKYCISWSTKDMNNDALRFRDVSVYNVSDFKSFLSAQYFTETPVTVWYVLAEPEEEPLENLLPIRTIKGTNILTVDTTVQPSEMYIKYRR